MEFRNSKIYRFTETTLSPIANLFKIFVEFLELYNPLPHIIEMYGELEKPVEDEELKALIKTKHTQYMRIVWNINKVTEFFILTILFFISFFVPYDDPLRINFKI